MFQKEVIQVWKDMTMIQLMNPLKFELYVSLTCIWQIWL